MLVDSHCHLNYPQFQNDFDGMLQRAAEAGVGYMQTICTRLEEFPNIAKIAEQHHNIFCSVGLHPLEMAKNPPAAANQLIELTAHPKVIGIGETGLDYHYSQDKQEHKAQQQSFIAHIHAAQSTGLPLIVHTRDAEDDTISIMSEHMASKRFTGVMHCFTGSPRLAQKALDMGFYLSASGIITFKNAAGIQQVFFDAPLDKILVETDSPYLAPVPHRGKDNEPAFVWLVAKHLASLRGLEFEVLADATTKNFFTLFQKNTGTLYANSKTEEV